MKNNTIDQLLAQAKKHYRSHARSHLPWRKTLDPYKIMVSEVMLQQTQVDRVIPFYKNFMKQFPNVRALAKAPLSDVLRAWNGLGYNRRGKLLRDAAIVINNKYNKYDKSNKNKFSFPKDVPEIERLPGIGSYTARAIATFAYNVPELLLETNIRSVFLWFLFQEGKKVADKDILPHIKKALQKSKMQPREFYWMLMDYGAHLKKSGIRLNHQSKYYTKQSKFEGSRRQLRGQILKLLIHKPHNKKQLVRHTKRKQKEVREELDRLEREKLIFQGIKGVYRVAK